LRSSKVAGIAAACFVDICKTSTYIPPTEKSVLRHIAADIENELRDKVFDFSRPTGSNIMNVSIGHNIDQQRVTTDFMLSLLRLDARSVLEKLVPTVLEEQVPTSFKLSLIKACAEISETHRRLPWYPMIISMHSYLAAPMRKLFTDYAELEILSTHVTVEGIPIERSKAASSKRLESQATSADISELLLNLLNLFSKNPLIALLVNNACSAWLKLN
jgi:hypothetical protein